MPGAALIEWHAGCVSLGIQLTAVDKRGIAMRVTGIVLAAIGLIAGIICLVARAPSMDPNQQAPLTNDAQVQRPNVVLPLVVCGVAVLVGCAMYMFGGRSYFISNDPRVRN